MLQVAIFAGALFIQLALGWNNLYLSILLLLVVTGLFTVLGITIIPPFYHNRYCNYVRSIALKACYDIVNINHFETAVNGS